MKKLLFVFLLFVTSLFGANDTLKNRILKGNIGDYVVTAQGSNYSLLLIRAMGDSRLTLEEIMVSQSNIDLKKINWNKWVENKAPGATSWTAFTFDLEKNTLDLCFSHLENQWLFIEKSDYIFGQLFTLPLRPTRDIERKRIGPAPMPGEIDRRKFWKPQLIKNGKKNKKPHFEIMRAKWPSDKTRLAGCVIELYLDGENLDFPFPYWMEVQSPHYTFKIRAIDSGKGLVSPVRLLK